MTGHRGRVGSMGWNGYILSTGSRDHHILNRDVRQQEHFMARLTGHRQEVCGLKWSYDEQQFASGGNDNKLFVWNLHSTTPVLKYHEHQAAVKAIAWSPHQHGLLASGGGTADRCIRFWNTVNNTALSCIDTGSQVCNLIWSKNVNEIVSTHGYSLNQIILWKYPKRSLGPRGGGMLESWYWQILDGSFSAGWLAGKPDYPQKLKVPEGYEKINDYSNI